MGKQTGRGEHGAQLRTSTPAPAILPSLSALSIAPSSTTPPRAVLIKIADFFICANASLSNEPRVESVRGQWRETTSAVSRRAWSVGLRVWGM